MIIITPSPPPPRIISPAICQAFTSSTLLSTLHILFHYKKKETQISQSKSQTKLNNVHVYFFRSGRYRHHFLPFPDRFSVAQSPVHTGPNDQIHTLILKNMQMVRSQFTRAQKSKTQTKTQLKTNYNKFTLLIFSPAHARWQKQDTV